MIIKSSQRGSPRALADHLESSDNETVTITRLDGVYSQTIRGVLGEFEAIAKGSRAEKPLYHVSISPSPNERMTQRDWDKVWAVHDKVHNLKNLQFVEVEHSKLGRVHRHRVYNRINPDTGKALGLSWTRMKNEKISRILEVKLGHKIIQGKHNGAVIRALRSEGLNVIADKLQPLANQPPNILNYDHKEWQAKKRGKNLDVTRAILADIWNRTKSPSGFQQELSDAGFIITQGKKVTIAIDKNGDEVPLLRAINTGRKQNGQSPIKKLELSDRLTETLPSMQKIKKHQAHSCKILLEIKTHRKLGTLVPVVYSGPRPDWLTRRHHQFKNAYNTNIPPELIRYWRFYQDRHGQVWLNNQYGAVVDKGDIIETHSKSTNLTICAEATVKLALTKGWTNAKVSGDSEYKLAVMKSAYKFGLDMDLSDPIDRQLWTRVNPSQKEDKKLELRPETNTNESTSQPSPSGGPSMR